MRYFTRLLSALLAFFMGLTLVAIWTVFEQPKPPAQSDEAVFVTGYTIEFFEWRQEKQSVSQSQAGTDAPPQYNYHQMESRHAAAESEAGQIDIVYHLENRGRQPVDLMILAVGDIYIWRDGPTARTSSLFNQEILLAERQNIGQQVIRGLAPGETREVKFTNFNLKAMVDKYLHKEYGKLRTLELQVNVDVRTLDQRQVMRRQQGRLLLNLQRTE